MFDIGMKFWAYFSIGIKYTIVLSAISLFFGTILGALIGIIKVSKFKILKYIASVYVEFVRGVPLLTQVFLFYFGSNELFGFNLDAFSAGVIAISLNSAAYVAEIIRSGIESVDKGQMEAGRSLGMSNKQTMKNIILPQAIKNILPALGNEFVTLIKETSIVSVIGIQEITFQTNIVKGISFRPLDSIYFSAILYFVLTFSISRLVGLMERRLKKSA